MSGSTMYKQVLGGVPLHGNPLNLCSISHLIVTVQHLECALQVFNVGAGGVSLGQHVPYTQQHVLTDNAPEEAQLVHRDSLIDLQE